MIVASYQGLSAEDMNDYRSAIINSNGTVNIVKNRLLKIALPQDIDKDALNELLTGSSSIAATDGDIIALAKSISDFAKEQESLSIRGGLLELSKVINEDAIKSLGFCLSEQHLFKSKN